MKSVNIITSRVTRFIFERSVRLLPIQKLVSQLEQSAKHIFTLLDMCSDTPGNRLHLRHIIGIERWGQRRLRVALGEPFLNEEYDHYRPSNERSWEELKDDWVAAREATLSLSKELIQANIAPDFKVIHNRYGPLSIKGWLRYIDVHASSEGKHIK